MWDTDTDSLFLCCTVPDPALQEQIMAYHMANQRLEQELQLLRVYWIPLFLVEHIL
jgi:hypothetical protein